MNYVWAVTTGTGIVFLCPGCHCHQCGLKKSLGITSLWSAFHQHLPPPALLTPWVEVTCLGMKLILHELQLQICLDVDCGYWFVLSVIFLSGQDISRYHGLDLEFWLCHLTLPDNMLCWCERVVTRDIVLARDAAFLTLERDVKSVDGNHKIFNQNRNILWIRNKIFLSLLETVGALFEKNSEESWVNTWCQINVRFNKCIYLQ